MIRVSGPVHGGTPPFKHDSIALSALKGNGQQNGKYRKPILKCNGQVDIRTYAASSMRPHNAQKIRFSPNPKSSIIQRPSPINELHFNVTKCESGSELSEPSLFAGSKSCVTPSPSELPQPPQNWMNSSVNKLLGLKSSEVVPLDLTHDSAVLAVGTEKDHLLKLKSILK